MQSRAGLLAAARLHLQVGRRDEVLARAHRAGFPLDDFPLRCDLSRERSVPHLVLPATGLPADGGRRVAAGQTLLGEGARSVERRQRELAQRTALLLPRETQVPTAPVEERHHAEAGGLVSGSVLQQEVHLLPALLAAQERHRQLELVQQHLAALPTHRRVERAAAALCGPGDRDLDPELFGEEGLSGVAAGPAAAVPPADVAGDLEFYRRGERALELFAGFHRLRIYS